VRWFKIAGWRGRIQASAPKRQREPDVWVSERVSSLCPARVDPVTAATKDNEACAMSKKAPQFSSTGFDLDIVGEGEVLDLTGNVLPEQKAEPEPKPEPPAIDPLLADAMQHKMQGNEAYKAQDYETAYRHYTDAINALPAGPSPTQILQQETEWKDERYRTSRERIMADSSKLNNEKEDKKEQEEAKKEQQPPEVFVLDPPHPHGPTLAIFLANRAACRLSQVTHPLPKKDLWDYKSQGEDEEPKTLDETRIDEAVADCNVAILVDPVYLKAWMRRATAKERQHDTEGALLDARQVLKLAQGQAKLVSTWSAHVRRLEKLEAERLEQLKTETMGKLKDLGNSILGNFGLSLDNFSTQQDPNTGSYNISFNQGGK